MSVFEILFGVVIFLLALLYHRKSQLTKELTSKTNQLKYFYQENKRIAQEKESLQRNINTTIVSRFKIHDARLRIKIIRNQLSPHFIFNSLNQIQEKVLSTDKDTAYRHVTKLSKFIRKIIDVEDNSDSSLKEEMDLIEMYLKIESDRLGPSFAYKISIDKSINCDDTQVLSMFIHPFLENLIWNTHYEVNGNKFLDLKIKIVDSVLLCLISCAVLTGVSTGDFYKVLSIEELPKTLLLADERIRLLGRIHKKESNTETTRIFNKDGHLKEMRTFIKVPIVT